MTIEGYASPIPGQTAPRLIATVKQTDRRQYTPTERNPFTDPPRGYDPRFDETRNNRSILGACKHYWTTQRNQSVLPEGSVNTLSGKYKIACFCQFCRWHVDLTIEYIGSSCPRYDSPVHHFVGFQRLIEGQEFYEAYCSVCNAHLRVDYRAPRLLPDHVALITDRTLLNKRFEAAKRQDPDRLDLKPAQPLEVLDALGCYIRDSLSPAETHKGIPRYNRRFMLSFGEDCTAFLEELEFEKTIDVWKLPQPPPPDPWEYDLGKKLQDIQEEIWSLMRAHIQSPNDKRGLRSYIEKPDSFDVDAQLLFSTSEYDKTRTTRRTPILSQEEELWYAGLGSLGDFSDDLLTFAFDRQVATDAVGGPYYYDCLSKIAKKRNSEVLEIKVATLASEGYFGQEDVTKAYRYFAIDPRQAHLYTDDNIRGMFESRLVSVQPWQEPEMREMLRMIGCSRGSKELQDAAANDIRTYDQALKWLEPTYSGSVELSDEQVINLAAVKKAEYQRDQSTQQLVEKAVRIISDQRNSDYLRTWLATGDAPLISEEDELTAAYNFYDIKDRSCSLDEGVLGSLRLLKESEDKGEGKAEMAEKYYDLLLRHIRGQTGSTVADYSTPVGLQNMGNTCYLNSLLQYFYAIKPFRDIVMNFDLHKQPLGPNTPDQLGRVGGNVVTRGDVKDGQEFVPELAILFEQMRTAPGPVVSPAWKLACLALKQSQGLARRSTIVGDRPMSIVHTTSTDAIKPASIKEDNERPSSPDSQTVSGDTSSDVTLVGDTILTPDSETDETQKETAVTSDDAINDTAAETDDQAGNRQRADSMEVQIDDANPDPPSRDPPPVPPRPGQDSWKSEAEKAANQHDVHEVVGNVLDKTLCAIKPDSIDADGNRSDKIKDLFYTTVRHSYPDKSLEELNELQNTFIVHFEHKPRDIYEGLDVAFGLEPVTLNGGKIANRYSTATHLAPFLQIYFQKLEFNKTTLESSVIKHHVHLEDTLYMDRYMPNASPELLQLRQLSWELREQRKKLKQELEEFSTSKTGLNGPETLDTTWQFINDFGEELDETSALKENLKAETERRREALEAVEKGIEDVEARLYSIPFNKFDTAENSYKLFAVFVHRGPGGSRGGHYWIYIHDSTNDIWRRYEDRDVRQVTDLDEIFAARDPETQGAPNFVVYVRDDLKAEMIDALNRVQPESTSPADVEMTDLEVASEFKTIDGVDPSMLYHG